MYNFLFLSCFFYGGQICKVVEHTAAKKMGHFNICCQYKQFIEVLIDTASSYCLPFNILANRIDLKQWKFFDIKWFLNPFKTVISDNFLWNVMFSHPWIFFHLIILHCKFARFLDLQLSHFFYTTLRSFPLLQPCTLKIPSGDDRWKKNFFFFLQKNFNNRFVQI